MEYKDGGLQTGTKTDAHSSRLEDKISTKLQRLQRCFQDSVITGTRKFNMMATKAKYTCIHYSKTNPTVKHVVGNEQLNEAEITSASGLEATVMDFPLPVWSDIINFISFG